MRRRIRSPKGARGGASTGTRGGRGRARGGAKGRNGRGGSNKGGKSIDSDRTGNSSPTGGSDCVNIILKDNHHHSHHRTTSNHFSRAPNGSMSYGREPVLQLGSIPRRPFMGPAQQQHNGNNNYLNNNNNNNNVNNNNGGGNNDFYLHKKFKKVTATVDPAPSTSNSEASASVGGGSAEGAASAGSSSTAGMVYKPKFRIKSELEAAQAAAQQERPPSPSGKVIAFSSSSTSLLSPREKASSTLATSAPELLIQKQAMTSFNSICSEAAAAVSDNNIHARLNNSVISSSCGGGSISNLIISSSSLPVSNNKGVVSPSALSSRSSHSSGSGSNHSDHPGRLTKEMRLDRKSLDDHISKLIDKNQSLLEWPEQFTKMLKNHTSRGHQNAQQRTSHLLSGGSTTELPASSPSSSSNLLSHHQQQPNGLLRHSSTSSEMSTSGGSVELLTTPSHHHNHGLLNNSGLGGGRSGQDHATTMSFQHSLSNPEIHNYSLSCGATSLSSVNNGPTDLSFDAHNITSTSTVTTIVRPSSASSTGSASSSTTTSSVVPKKRRRLSPTPSRLCGGEVSELPVNQPVVGGNKNYFQDVDMTVRVSNCGPSGAKVTIRTNNGNQSGGSVQSASPGVMTPVDFSKMIDNVSSPHAKPVNGAIFFPGPGPSSPSTIKPLSLVSTHKAKTDVGLPGNGLSPKGSLLISNNSVSVTESRKPQKGTRGRPSRKKSVPEATAVDCTTSIMSSGASLLRLAQPPAEIPSRPDSRDSLLLSPVVRAPLTSVPIMSASSPVAISLLTASASTRDRFPSQKDTVVQEVITITPSVALQRSAEPDNKEPTQEMQPATASGSPTLKSENAQPAEDKESPFQVVPTPTQNPKRPTFLALKPVNTNSKKTEPGVLPSPETPRVAKPYNQMTINGQAYTYLGFKVSTRSSYTCLFKTQPMFIPQESDPKLSMYTNWQPRPRDPSQLSIGISTNDSRVNGRKSLHNIIYTSAYGKGCDTLTVSSPDSQAPISSPVCETKTFLSGIETKVSSSVSASAAEDIEAGGSSCSSSAGNRFTESQSQQQQSPFPCSSSSRTAELTKPIQIEVTPSPNSGIVPISPPSRSSSPVPFLSSSNSAVGSGGLMSIAAFSPKLTSANVMNLSARRDSKSAKRRGRDRGTPPMMMSSSDTNSVDESSSNGFRRRRRSTLKSQDDDAESNLSDGPLALTGSKGERESEEARLARYESNRVRIMEGGFESNEDYTYVRGRGRGRYVCEACGIRCKKPSMLRKHLKTHTDLRPYTCKLCNFSFKTKGNLTKHQKSKSHHKKCAGLGIHPESSTSLAMTGPAFSISDANTTDDNDSDDDDFDDNGDGETDSQDECDDSGDGNENGSESFEKEIAQSLLDLSKATVRLPSGGSASCSDYESSNDARVKTGRPSSGFPYSSMIEDISNSSVGSYTTGGDSVPVPETPIDLTVSKPAALNIGKHLLEPDVVRCENDSKKIKLEKNGLIKAVGVVKEAEAWEPAVDEASRCLNLRRVLNNSESENSSVPEPRVTEIKTEVPEFPNESRIMYGPRERTESETSNCSAASSSFAGVSLTHPPEVAASTSTGKRLSPITPPPSQTQGSTTSASGSVKLHQPWLSPSEPKDKKEAGEAPSVESRPANASADTAASVKTIEDIELREAAMVLSGSSAGPPPAAVESGVPGLGGVLSPKSKLFAGLSIKPQAEFRQPSGAQALVKDEGKAECNVCGKTFARASQLTLHMNIHYIERPFRCDPCGVSFRTKGHLIKHRRSSSHDCKVYLTEAWGVANEENPRPFKCPECKIAFRIHGHLAKHLRSKMHIMRMECLGKLPFGIYFEMEKSGINLNEIDTTDCDMSLVSLQNVARKIYGDQWRDRLTVPVEEPPV